MAYRKKRHTRHRRPVFSKRAKAAILRIAQQPVETKHLPLYTTAINAFINTGYLTGSTWNIRQNIYSEIPRASNVATQGEREFLGNEFMSRGLRIMFNFYTTAGVPGALADVQFRFTVYKENGYQPGLVNLAVTDRVFDQDVDITPTFATWNQQVANIIFQRRFKLDNNGNNNAIITRKFWVPLRKKMVAAGEESLLVNSFFGQAKDLQYYWVLEIFAPGITNLQTFLNGSINQKVYFKDA